MYPTIICAYHNESAQFYIQNFLNEQGLSSTSVFTISPQPRSISINQVRELKRELKLKLENRRVIVFEQFETATLEAQNALLKALEEKNISAKFFLLSSQVESILPTIVSRCTVIYTHDLSSEAPKNISSAVSSFIEKPSVSSMSDPLLQPGSIADAVVILKAGIVQLRQKLKEGNTNGSTHIRKAFDLLYKLQHNNLNPQLTVDDWLLSFLKKSV